MAQMLAEALGEGHARGAAAAGGPGAHCLEILVDAVMRAQPVALAGVAGQHVRLEIDDMADVDGKAWRHVAAKNVLALDRIAIVEMRDAVEWRRLAAVT